MPTTNPVPSQDPSDLLFNAGKLDEVLNGTGNSFTDRLGVARRTVAGMNADFDAQLADAESDLNVYRADAAASAAEALGYLQTIRATSYGAYASDPATDPLGNPPTIGDEYFNTTANLLKRWNGTTWQAGDINTANLAASSGSSLVGYQSAGTGAVATTVQNKLRETVSVFDFMTAAQISDVKSNTSSIDVTSAIQAAIDYAVSSGLQSVYAPAGSYKITATLNVGRITFIGAGLDATVFVSYITNGTAVFKYSNIYFGAIEKIRVTAASFDVNGFIAGTSNGQDCIGVELDSAGSDFSRNFVIRDVMCYGLKTGYRIDGFIGNTDNCCAWWCETGLNGNLLNSVTLNLNFEGCRKDFVVVNSTGLLFDRCIFEGATLASGLAASTVDDCQGVTFDSLYMEQNRNTPFMIVGGTTLVTDVNVFGASIASQPLATSAYDLDTALIKFDKVDGLRVDASISPGNLRSLYEVTANTKNFFDFSIPRGSAQFSILDNSNSLVSVKNHFPNPNFDLWFRGWPGAGASGCSLSKETSIVRSGKNAARVTRTAGATGTGFVYFAFSDGYLASALAGKTVTLYSWIYIPNITEFDPNYTAGGSAKRTAFPYISINVNGTGGGTATASTFGGRRGGWNLQRITVNVPSDCTSITVYLNIQTPAAATGNEYIVCDSIYIVEGSYAYTAKVANGQVTDSEIIQSSGLVGKLVSRSSAAPVSTFQSYEVGDQVLNISPAAGGAIGWVCTTAGSPGTWKTFGAVSA